MLKTIRYTLAFESQLLIGTTASLPGIYDRITTLDDNGLPYVPASSIRGRVKDAIRTFLRTNAASWQQFLVCAGQDPPVTKDDNENDFSYCIETTKKPPCPLCRIFGAPGGLKQGFSFSGVYYPENTTALLKETFGSEPSDLTNASLVRRVRNKHDEKLRRAREDHLFADGVAELMASLEGTIRETPVHLSYNDDIKAFNYRLLFLGMRLTTELGATRNRGYGNCILHPTNGDWIDEIEELINEWQKTKG